MPTKDITVLPSAGTPIVDARNNVSPIWWSFFNSIYQKLGSSTDVTLGDATSQGTSNSSSISALASQINKLTSGAKGTYPVSTGKEGTFSFASPNTANGPAVLDSNATASNFQVFPTGSQTKYSLAAVAKAALNAISQGGAAFFTSLTIGTQSGPTISASGQELIFSGSIKPQTTGGIVGTTTADNANTGSIGEFLTASVPSGSALALTSATPANITQITLSPGDWDVWGTVATNPASTTLTTKVQGGTSTTSATLPGIASGSFVQLQVSSGTIPANDPVILSCGTQRINVSATTTVYLVMSVTFSTSTLGGYGAIFARRAR